MRPIRIYLLSTGMLPEPEFRSTVREMDSLYGVNSIDLLVNVYSFRFLGSADILFFRP